MSLICLCATDMLNQFEFLFYKQRLTQIAESYEYGIAFSVKWDEPLVRLLSDSYVFSLSDSMKKDNCERLLLPDGWYFGDYTNITPFRNRMRFLKDIADMLIFYNHKAEFYIGLSGSYPSEFSNSVVKLQNLLDYLTATVGCSGAEKGFHISVEP